MGWLPSGTIPRLSCFFAASAIADFTRFFPPPPLN
jgi:hypothetical protein